MTTELETFVAVSTDLTRIDMHERTASTNDAGNRFPFVLVTAGRFAVVIRPVVCADHLSVDLHPFVDGRAGGVGMGGMTMGQMWRLAETDAGQVEPGWNAVRMGIAVIGDAKR